MLPTANGIEHASSYLSQNFERFLNIRRLNEILAEETERGPAISSVRHMMTAARAVGSFLGHNDIWNQEFSVAERSPIK